MFPKQNCLSLCNNYWHFLDFCCHFSQIILIELQGNQCLKLLHIFSLKFLLLSLKVI